MKQGDALGAQAGAHDAYASARAKLQSLVGRSPQFAEAWNALGYTQRKLGSFDDSLASYAQGPGAAARLSRKPSSIAAKPICA